MRRAQRLGDPLGHREGPAAEGRVEWTGPPCWKTASSCSEAARAANTCSGSTSATYSSKAVLVKESGEVAASAGREHVLLLPEPGHVEHDAERLVGRFPIPRPGIAERSGADPRRMRGIGLSTISPAVVPVDEAGRALRPAILYGVDTRATREIQELAALTGAALSSQSAAPKVMWIGGTSRRCGRAPEDRERLRIPGAPPDRAIRDRRVRRHALRPLLRSIRAGLGSGARTCVAPVQMMPRPRWTCEEAGQVTPERRRETGLAAELP